jgi:RHS repeat-associated protein
VTTDRLGSVRSGGPGGLGYQAQYPYGVEHTLTANDREKYATYTRDSLTGLDYAVNRYYNSYWGRFLSPDPYLANSGGPGDPADPQSWNRYTHTRNDPDSRLDPTGLNDCEDAIDCIGGGIDWGDPYGGGSGNGGGGPNPCDSATAAAGIPGLSYALRGGKLTSVDYGPFQINQRFNPNPNGSVWGTSGAGQTFNGNPDANIGFGIQILEGLYTSYGNNAAGRYVGSLGNTPSGAPINQNAQNREAAWNKLKSKLTALFSDADCFHHSQ